MHQEDQLFEFLGFWFFSLFAILVAIGSIFLIQSNFIKSGLKGQDIKTNNKLSCRYLSNGK